MNGFEMILPFLKPIEHLILDDSISEVMVNGPDRVFIEKQGFLQHVPGVSIGEKSLMVAVKNIARRLGDDISESKPILDSRLPDGSRVAAIIPPCSLGGVTLTIFCNSSTPDTRARCPPSTRIPHNKDLRASRVVFCKAVWTYRIARSKQTSRIRSTSLSIWSAGPDADTSPRFSSSTATTPMRTFSTTALYSKPNRSRDESGHDFHT